MYKKFLNAILFGALILGSAGTITSCKDYDDEIDEINQRISGLSGLTDQLSTLTSQLSTAASEASAAKSSATAALENANKALEAAGVAADEAAKAAANEAIAAANAAAAAADAATAATDLKAAQAAAAKAQEAADAAKKAAENAAKAATSQDDLAAQVAKAAEDAAAAAAKVAEIETLKQEVSDLNSKIESAPKGLSEDQLKDVQKEVDKLTAKALAVMGHRLQSLSVVANTHINGIAAITMTSLQYVPQKHVPAPQHAWGQDKHATRPVVDHKDITDKTGKSVAPVYLTTKENTAYFHVNPNLGVTRLDIKDVAFNNIKSDNTFTRAEFDFEKGAELNKLLIPTSFDINRGVMEVKYTKADPTKKITSVTNANETKETFQMVSLRAQIADKWLKDDETEAFVNSEYVRVEELFKAPFIAHEFADFNKTTGDYADEVQAAPATIKSIVGNDGLFVHYHDSLCLYDSEVNRYVDILANYNDELDLKKWVTVCTVEVQDGKVVASHNGHEKMSADEAEAYGLEFRFYMPEKPYITLGGPEGNSNRTDQQKFAKVTEDGIMTSHVYGEYTNNRDAVGREPIVRVELWDKNNGNLVDVRYIKVKWVQEIGQIDIAYEYPSELYVCGDYKSLIGTKDMNIKFYANPDIKEGGMSKAEFHAAYTEANFKDGGKADGTVRLVPNTETDVDSYNIEWTITHADFLKKYKTAADWAKNDVFVFTKTFTWESATNKKLVVTLTKKIYKPAFSPWGYDNRYWRNTDGSEYTVFNVNPIVFDTQESNPAWGANTTNNPTSNIYTDLLNGFVDDIYKKPIFGAEGAVKFTVSDKLNRYYVDEDEKYLYAPGKNYYYSDFYGDKTISDAMEKLYNRPGVTWNPKARPALALEASRGVVRTPDYASYENVRFVFDAEKLKSNNDLESDGVTKKYVYDYNGKPLRATVSKDGTKLYINNELAAEILNSVVNNLPADADHPERDVELTYNIRLQEANPSHAPFSGDVPTEAAKALVGKLVPIKMVADICGDEYAVVTIKPQKGESYDAYIIEPLRVSKAETDFFTDATIGGSTIDVRDANIYKSWNADEKGYYYPVVDPNKTDKLPALKAYIVSLYKSYKKNGSRVYTDAEANAKAELAVELGKFYEATDAVWDTKNIRTNLKRDNNGNLVPDWSTKTITNVAGETEEVYVTQNGAMPSNTEVVYDGTAQTLTYHNYSGTPVNNDYLMFIPVKYGYKWKTQVDYLQVLVKSNKGTDDNQQQK